MMKNMKTSKEEQEKIKSRERWLGPWITCDYCGARFRPNVPHSCPQFQKPVWKRK